MHKSIKIPCCLWVACAMLFLSAPDDVRAQSRRLSAQQSSSQERRDRHLLLYNTHTAERIDIVYRRGEQYIPSALAQLDKQYRFAQRCACCIAAGDDPGALARTI